MIEAGPPAGSPVTREAWRDWHRYGFVVCPRRKTTCSELECGIGVSCIAMRAIGLAGDGSPLKRKDRPRCGARNRQDTPAPFAFNPVRRAAASMADVPGVPVRPKEGAHRRAPAAAVGAGSPYAPVEGRLDEVRTCRKS